MTGPGLLNRQRRRRIIASMFAFSCAAAATLCVVVLFLLVGKIFSEGAAWLNWDFLWNLPSRHPEKAGIKTALAGSLWLTGLTAVISLPVGIGAAVYLEEYAAVSRWKKLFQINIANLAGVPSIVYGILGLAVFVQLFTLGSSLISGALTLSLVILPIIILATQEALRGGARFNQTRIVRAWSDSLADRPTSGSSRCDARYYDRGHPCPFSGDW